MGNNTEYIILFKGLENGIHNFSFQVSTEFFTQFEKAIVQKGNYKVHLILDKRDQMLILDFSFEGEYEASCDRCLAQIGIPTIGEDQIIAKLKDENDIEVKDNVVFLEADAHSIDVAPFINDMVHLNLPLVNERDCEADDYKYCDHDILDKLEDSAGEDDKEEETQSGNWDVLKDLNLE